MPRIIDGESQNIIGNKIRKLRNQNKWSQQELSEKLETYAVYVCRGSISRIECSDRTITDIEAYAFAKAFNISVGELFEDVGGFDN
jgi:transcriptional regulator with XRE-family HTH domain